MVLRHFTVIVALSLLTLSACKKTPQDNAAERDAKFRAEQKARAIKTYKELVDKYPESEYASKAKERLSAIQPAATPAKK